MINEELIARLRDRVMTLESMGGVWVTAEDYLEVEDRIEALTSELARLETQCEGLFQAAKNNGQALILAEAERDAAADRIETLMSENRALKRLNEAQSKMLDAEETRADRPDLAVEYILDGMGIHYPDYEIDAEDDFLDAANSKWVRDTLTRLAEAMRGNDDTR